MATVKTPREDLFSDPLAGEGPIYADNHETLYAAVLEGEEVKEYHLRADLEEAEATHKSTPVIRGESTRSNEKLTGSDMLLHVIGVKVDYDHHWTPASAVFALRRTLPRFIEKDGRVVDVQLDEDSVHLAVRRPRLAEDE